MEPAETPDGLGSAAAAVEELGKRRGIRPRPGEFRATDGRNADHKGKARCKDEEFHLPLLPVDEGRRPYPARAMGAVRN